MARGSLVLGLAASTMIAAACGGASGAQPSDTAAAAPSDAGSEFPALTVTASVPAIDYPIALVDTGDAVWALGHTSAKWSRIDPATNTVTDTVGVGGPYEAGGVLVDGKLWGLDFTGMDVTAVDPASRKVVATVPVGLDGGWLVGDGKLLFAVGNDADEVVRIDPATKKATNLKIDTRCGDTPAVGGGFLWLVSSEGRLCKLDPVTASVLGSVDGVGGAGQLAYAAGRVLIPGQDGGVVVVDPATMIIAAMVPAPPTGTFHGERYRLGVPEDNIGVLGDGTSAWVRYSGATVGRLDLSGDPSWTVYAGLPSGTDAAGVLKADGSMWFADAGGGTVVRTAIP
jgi:DNA-binding beta-propeller fold protein YncE